MANNLDVKLEEYKTQCKKDSEKLVKEVFPRNVLELHALLQEEMFSPDRLDKINPTINIPVPDPILLTSGQNGGEIGKKRKLDAVQHELPTGTKVTILPDGPVPSNPKIMEMVEVVKPRIRDVIEHANQIKMWLAYSIPKIEDGNNFGVGIQEEILGEARQVETEAATFLDQISRYYVSRGKIISKIAKYPHVIDFRSSVREIDEKQVLTLRLIISELRNQYASLHDMIMKNLEKIKKPRSVNTVNMY